MQGQNNYKELLKKVGISYLGSVSSSVKIKKNKKKGVMTYIIYLAPSNLSGFNVCPMATESCIKACLHESGQNRLDVKRNMINAARIRKTKLFFQDRETFMQLAIHEINKCMETAKRKGFKFSIRLNGTSDISPEMFYYNGKNILQMYPRVQFYDYTKVFNRSKLLNKYKNYNLTFSFSGENWAECEDLLTQGHI
jgi:hypothetical protein